MSNCLFPWCLPKSLEFLVETPPGDEEDSVEDEKARRRKQKTSLLKVDGDGVLQIPMYRKMRREQSRLLSYAWAQNWDQVIRRCQTHPEEATHMTQHSKRTALHLATFNHPCPLQVAQALLKANRHMVLVQDSNWYTPLHNVAFFPGESLVKIVCDTAVMVEQELGSRKKAMPPISGTSPLFLAAKRAAPLRTLRQLLETRKRTEWIAPSTGGEPYWMETLDEYSSPIEVMLRDRAITTWGLQKYVSTSETRESESSAGVLLPTKLSPRLLWQMKQIANERLRVCRAVDSKDDKPHEKSTILPVLDAHYNIISEQELQAVALWTKCVELLVEHVPRLLEDDDAADLTMFTPPPDCEPEYRKDQFALVHCVASAKVPLPNLLQVALMVFPEQALMRDEYGMLPLHHVLMAKHPYATKTLVSMLLNHAPQAALYWCSYPPRVTLSTVDDEFPMSTISALGLAISLGHSLEILKELLWADSDLTLTTIDPVTGLYPFASAASKGYDLDVVYTLLNAHPQVLNHYLNKSSAGQMPTTSMMIMP